MAVLTILKEVESQNILDHIWQTQVEQIYSEGTSQTTLVAAMNPITNRLEEKQVKWFKSPFTRHVCIVNQDSMLGLSQNPWTFSLLRYWLKAVLVPINREFSVVDNVINFSNKTLSQYFKASIELEVRETPDILQKKIICKESSTKNGKLRLPQISIDSSGFVMTRPDAFLPSVDILKTAKDYTILLDIPGMYKSDIQITRRNVITIIKGKRKRLQEFTEDCFQKNERKFGEFTLNFKIPDEYERKWFLFEVNNGTLCLKYKRDTDDVIIEE